MNYVLGLDVGIASVGWALLELNYNDEPERIIDLGSRIFDKAEVPKTGASLAMPRRLARGQRRRLRRRRFRLHRVRGFLVRHGIMTKEELEKMYQKPPQKDIYQLREEALYEKVNAMEWSRLLLFFAKHRGFESNRENDKSGEEGIMLNAIRENHALLENYKTVGEMFCKNEKFKERKRNKAGDYQLTVSRAMLADEIKKLFTKQREQGQRFAGKDLEEEYMKIFSARRSFEEGPGENSIYAGDQIEKMIGICTFEDGKDGTVKRKRAPKASYAFMTFNLWQKINHFRIHVKGKQRFLTKEEREKLADLLWTKATVTYADIRKALELSEEERFSDVTYDFKQSIEESEKKEKCQWVNPYHDMRKALDKVHKGRITELPHAQVDEIAYVFTVYKNDQRIHEELIRRGIAEKDATALVENLHGFSKFGHVSCYFCYRVLPFLKAGDTYDKACAKAGYDFRKENIEDINDIPNPVVKRSISQTLKVVRAIIRTYGNPVEIHIELARELGRNYRDRKNMEESMKENQKENERIKNRLVQEFHVMQPTGQDIVKLKLYEQQEGDCAYSQEKMDINRLFEKGYAEVDHIIPYSRSFDDTYKNKVLVLTKENREKRNQTPMEYLKDKPGRKEKFVAWVKSTIRDCRKRENLLRETYTDEEAGEWKQRNLQDTQYISRFLYNYLRKNIILADGHTSRKKRIIPFNGAVTGYVRKRWGIRKIRENGDLHHAIDAVVIAAMTEGLIQKVTRYSQIGEIMDREEMWVDEHTLVDQRTGEILPVENAHKNNPFPQPWPQFRKELEARMSESPTEAIRALRLSTYSVQEEVRKPFVSRMPRRKITGPAHEETVRSGVLEGEGYTVSKKDLSTLKIDKKTGEIEGYYRPESDRLLYEALKERLRAFGGDGKKAFKEPFYKPKSDGTSGPLVKKVKVKEKSNKNLRIHGGKGVAANGSMIRIDVFSVKEKGKDAYYFVPIYVADTVTKELPNKAVVSRKPHEDWKEMRDEDFIFSLYPNDLIHIMNDKPKKLNKVEENSTLAPTIERRDIYLYYQKAGVSTASIKVISHDNTYKIESLGLKELGKIEKCVVDALGRISAVKKEKRQTFR